ncbi:glycosyltransferase family 2 protein [Micrococcus luteus]|uniref:glycosyltransferase family 2 protein n=1 Tax=Micrococcus luteus TaxID=1270 RepID=UPI000BF105B7|nr:hypothetical protein CRM77_05180 [Micrococcus luteus]
MPAFPELSIIIPRFRNGYRLHDQVFALRDQEDRPSLEVLLCDNGSNCGLTEWVANFPHDDPDFKVRLIDATDHSGVAFARNRGIAAVQADLRAFCDDDDLVHPRWARSAVGLLEDHRVITGGVVPRCKRS